MAETKISKTQTGSGIWTSTNLTAGTNISFSQVLQPIIDEHTIGLWHFETTSAQAQESGYYPNEVADSPLVFNYYNQAVSGKTSYTTTSYAKFGSMSWSGVETNSYATLGKFLSGSYSVGQGDFTVDYWFNHVNQYTSSDKYPWIIGLRLSTSSSGNFTLQPNINEAYVAYPSNTTSTLSNLKTPLQTWHHFAIERWNGVAYMYYDGTKIAQTELTTSIDLNNVFNYYDAKNQRWVMFDELRISNVARYQGQNFTPFDRPYSFGGDPIYRVNNTLDISGKQDALTGATGYDATKNQVLKNATGTLEWGEGSDVAVDNKTIIQDPVTKEISTYGTLVNTSVDESGESGESGEFGEPVVRYNWEGTKAEYEKLKKNNLINDDWYYRITDDVEPASIVTLLRINLVTQEEYDNLTEEEKLSGTYGIIDDESYGG